jgi:hypothetical protein
MRLALLVFLGLLLAQEPAPPAAGSGRIAGTVRNAGTGVPLKDATVTLSPPPVRDPKPISAITGEDGRFVLGGVPAGSYTVIATLPGFAFPDADRSSLFSRGPYINLANGQRTENVTIGLAATLSITGRVLDRNGQPSSLITVTPGQKTYDANGIETVRGVPAGYGRPDANGAYRISGLLPGEYYIMTGESGGLTTYYPGVRSLKEAVPVVVSGSDLGGIDFRIVPTEKFAVRFRVTGIFPVPRELNLLLNGVPATTVPTPADGWFTIPLLPPRDYDLTIQWTDSPSDPTAPPTLLAGTT